MGKRILRRRMYRVLAYWSCQVNKNMPPEKTELVIFTSSLQRTIQTTQYIPARKVSRIKLHHLSNCMQYYFISDPLKVAG